MFFKKTRNLLDKLLKNKAKELKYPREGTVVALIMKNEEIVDATILETKRNNRVFSNSLVKYFDILTGEEFFEEIPNERGLKLYNITLTIRAIDLINEKLPESINNIDKDYFILKDIIDIEKKFLIINKK